MKSTDQDDDDIAGAAPGDEPESDLDEDLRDEDPSDEDVERFGEDADTDTTECSHCGSEIYDDADRCPACGMNAMRSGREPSRSRSSIPAWAILAALMVAAALLLMLFMPAL